MASRRMMRDEAIRSLRRELPEPEALDTAQGAAFVGLTRRQMEHLRCRGGGPRYVKLGRHVRYLRADLIEWLHAHRVRSTSEVGS